MCVTQSGYGRDRQNQLFIIDTIQIRYQWFLVVSLLNFDTDASKFCNHLAQFYCDTILLQK